MDVNRPLNLHDFVATTEPALVDAAVRFDDQTAWGDLYRSFREPVLRLCGGSGLTPEESDEVLQDAFVRLHRLLGRKPEAWATVGLRHLIADLVQQLIVQRHQDRRSFIEKHRGLVATARLLAAAQSEDPSSDREAPLWSLCIARVRNQVRPDHWQIFETYNWDGLSSREVGRQFGVTAIEVRVVSHRILSKLRSEWGRLLSADNLDSP